MHGGPRHFLPPLLGGQQQHPQPLRLPHDQRGTRGGCKGGDREGVAPGRGGDLELDGLTENAAVYIKHEREGGQGQRKRVGRDDHELDGLNENAAVYIKHKREGGRGPRKRGEEAMDVQSGIEQRARDNRKKQGQQTLRQVGLARCYAAKSHARGPCPCMQPAVGLATSARSMPGDQARVDNLLSTI